MKTLLELESDDCRFAFGERDFQFCAKPKYVFMRLNRLCVSAYCHEHHLICVVEPTPAKRSAA
jgi:hypothetical protein